MGPLQVRRWTRQEYDRMVEAGVLAPGERAELIDGEVLAMTPQGSLHATAVRLAEEALRAAFGAGYDIRVQMPLALDPSSEPEPDVAVVRGSPRDYRDAHPAPGPVAAEAGRRLPGVAGHGKTAAARGRGRPRRIPQALRAARQRHTGRALQGGRDRRGRGHFGVSPDGR